MTEHIKKEAREYSEEHGNFWPPVEINNIIDRTAAAVKEQVVAVKPEEKLSDPKYMQQSTEWIDGYIAGARIERSAALKKWEEAIKRLTL